MIRVPQVGAESGAALSTTARRRSTRALKQANLGNFTVVGSEIVGPDRRPGADDARASGRRCCRWSASSLYIGFRFQFSFGVGAIVATIHDLLVTLAFLAFFRYDLTLNVIAALLTITGFSTNDTIVIFDRVRENLRAHAARLARPTSSTSSINQTLGRTDHHRRARRC